MIFGNKKYPTEKEIMDPPVKFKDTALDVVMSWKTKFFPGWNVKSNTEKLEALECLIQKLCGVYEENVIVDQWADAYAYNEQTNTIYLDGNNPSIISTLHEFRHKINGPDELSACRWSIQIFKRCFPKSFEKLKFKDGGHLLIKRD